ncbi:MAG: glycosyltransferase [Alphaproteobacteria bacterium]
MSDKKIFCFGLGYTGKNISSYIEKKYGWSVSGTKRSNVTGDINVYRYDPNNGIKNIKLALENVTDLLISIAPNSQGDIVLQNNIEDINNLCQTTLKRIIYLSTTAVYGNYNGDWIDEEAKLNPSSKRAVNRVCAERQWLDIGKKYNINVDILRLSGIYGVGRNQINNLLSGNAKRVIKDGQIFNRINVVDISIIVDRLISSDLYGDIYNISDDEPCPPQEVVEYAANLIGVSPPVEVAFDKSNMSEMAKSFYSESKKVLNNKIKEKLNIELMFSNYRCGLNSVVDIKNLYPKAANIMQVAPAIDIGGAEQTCVEISSALSQCGLKSYLASSKGRLLGEYYATGGVHINLPLKNKNPFSLIKNTFSLIHFIKKYNINIIHARSRAPAWSAYLASKITRCQFITTYHGIYGENNRLKRFYNSVMARGDIVIANSGFTKKIIMERYNTPEYKISVIHRGVDTEKFNRKNIDVNHIKNLMSNWKIDKDTSIILLPGRVTEWKGHKIALEAVSRIKKNNTGKFKLIFTGDDKKHKSYVEELKSLIRDLKLEEEVLFTGHTNNIENMLYIADVVLSVSVKPEAFGRIIAEAQSMGKPVIATDIGPVREILSIPSQEKLIQRTGWVFKKNDIDELVSCINMALKLDNHDKTTIANIARDNMVLNFTTKIMTEKTIRIYSSLLGKN